MTAALRSTEVTAHKLDSLLRGNWATELAHLGAPQPNGRRRRVLVVPASPALGRVCVDGLVTADGIPVDRLADVRRAAVTSRPAARLDAVNVTVDGLQRWLAGDEPIAVCDATSMTDVVRIAEALAAEPDILLSAPAAVLGVALRQRMGGPTRVADPPAVRPPFVAVVGSVHPMAQAQAQAAVRYRATVICSDVTAGSADVVLADLARRARPATNTAGTIVIVGGDTAAMVLGNDPVWVNGLLGPGMPWFSAPRFPDAVVITKPGSFGHPGTLVELFSGRMAR